MANSVTHAALPYPVKGARYTLGMVFLDADGDPTDQTTPDTERSIDGASFADCTEEVTAVTGGFGYITITGDELNSSLTMVAAKAASGPKTTPVILYPRVLPVIHSGTAQAGANGSITLDSGASAANDFYNGAIVKTTGGTGGAGGSGSLNNQARVITDYNGSTKVASVVPNWETNPSNDTTFEVLATAEWVAAVADVIAISGDVTAADNLELQFDGTGLTGDTYPATQAQVGNIATTGAPAYAAVDSFTKTVGGSETGSYSNTDTSNGVYHQIADSAGTLDVYYEYLLRPDEVATGVVFKGRMTGSGDNAVVQAYNWTGSAWVTLFSLTGTNTTTDTTQSPALVSKYTGTGVNIGKVRIRVYGTGLTSANLYVDQCIIAKADTSRTVGYSQGAIWIDATNGTAGTTTYFNGTADHPVDTWADALDLAAALDIYRFQVAPGTQITLTKDSSKHAISGRGYKLALGGQECSYLAVDGCEYVTGIALAAAWEMFFWNCQMGACTLGEFDAHNCHITDTITLGANSTPFLLNGCVGVPIGTPGIDFASTSNNTVVIGNARGVWTISNMSAGDTLYIDGNCVLTLAASCTGGTVYISGNVALTNSGTGQTIIQGEVNADLLKISGSSTAADKLEASALGVVTGTAVTGTLTTTAFTTSLTEATDDHYNGRVIVFTSGALAGQAKAVLDYDGATKLVTTRAFTEAPTNNDNFVLV